MNLALIIIIYLNEYKQLHSRKYGILVIVALITVVILS